MLSNAPRLWFQRLPSPERERALRKIECVQRLLIRRSDGWQSRSTVMQFPLLVEAICRDWIRVDYTRLPADICARAQSDRVIYHGREAEPHARLKLAALGWMKGEGAADAKAEVRMGGWIADAYSESYLWAVECGNTDASRLVDAIRWHRAPRFTILPFQRTHTDDHRARRLIAVDFYWRPSLTRWLEDHDVIGMRRAASALEFP
ncbi:MAG: hypothetical protein PGN33_14130 [Methylobacterium radiotolerans]